MTCFTNLDYKYVHISFIALIQWGRRVAPNYFLKTHTKNRVLLSQSKDQLCFLTPGGEQSPHNPLLLLLLAVTRCHCHRCYCPGGWDAIGGPGSGLTALFCPLSHTQSFFPKAWPLSRVAGWEGASGVSHSPASLSPPLLPVQMRIEHQPIPLHSKWLTLEASLLFPASAPWTGKLDFAPQRLGVGYGCLCFQRALRSLALQCCMKQGQASVERPHSSQTPRGRGWYPGGPRWHNLEDTHTKWSFSRARISVPGVLMFLPNPGVLNPGIRSGIQGGHEQVGGKKDLTHLVLLTANWN